MLLKIIVVMLLLVIFYCLGSAVVYLVRDGSSVNMAKALTWRIVLSLLLFLFLILTFVFGWVTPHGIAG